MGASQSMEQYLDRPSTETGLRRREMKALIACWAVIEQDLRDQSIKLFVRLMRKHPEYRRYFRTLASSSPRVLSSIAADARVQTHFRNILTSVGSLVYTSVNKPDNLVPKYDFLALVHRHIGLGLQDFFNFRDELIDYFKSEFPSQMTPLCVGAWHTLLTRAFTEICLRIDEYHRTAPREGTHKRQAEEDAQDGESAVSCKSVASMFEAPGELLYWDHRKPFWRTQQELWGVTSDDEWEDEDEEEDAVVEEVVLDEPEPRETQRHRRRRLWRRFTKRLRRLMRRMCGV